MQELLTSANGAAGPTGPHDGKPAGSFGGRISLVAKARGRVQLLQKEQEGAVVPLLAASVIKLLESITHRLDDWQLRQAYLLGRRQHRVEILDEVPDRRTRAEVAVDHAPAVLLEHTAVGMPAGQCNWDLGGVGTAGARKQEALRHACDVAGDHYLVGELGDLAAAGGTDVARPAHRLPHPVALGAVEIAPLAAGHDRKRALGGAEAAARDRGIEMANPALLEPGGVLLRHLRWDRGHVDEYGIALHRIRGAAVEEHLADNRPAIEDGQDIVGALHAVGWISGNPGALHGKRVGLEAGAVPYRSLEPRLHQIGDHRCAHDAGAEKCDLVRHCRSP